MKNGWQRKKIGEVCRLMTGGTPSKAKPEYFGGEIRWLVSGDINQGEIFDCEGRITEAGMKNSNAKLLPVNSVMIALNGQGKTCKRRRENRPRHAVRAGDAAEEK